VKDAGERFAILLATVARFQQHSGNPQGCGARSPMKAKIIVTPKKAVLDPQGKTVQNALEHMGYKGVGAVHVGKYLEIELSGTDKSVWNKQIDEACHKILSNPVIEDYRFEIVE
jgi:phosphoribosylformylglycinamidine synthase PurS subunit